MSVRERMQQRWHFVRTIDWLFDIVNSHSPFAVGFKAALRSDNMHYWTGCLSKLRDYILAFSYNYIVCLFVVDVQTLICDFHRKQAWMRWTSATRNNVSQHPDEVLCVTVLRPDAVRRWYRKRNQLHILPNFIFFASTVPAHGSLATVKRTKLNSTYMTPLWYAENLLWHLWLLDWYGKQTQVAM